jgi:hypothetical protein
LSVFPPMGFNAVAFALCPPPGWLHVALVWLLLVVRPWVQQYPRGRAPDVTGFIGEIVAADAAFDLDERDTCARALARASSLAAREDWVVVRRVVVVCTNCDQP